MLVGVTDLPAELSRCFLLIRELDQKSSALQAEIEDRCRKHVLDHTEEYQVCQDSVQFKVYSNMLLSIFSPSTFSQRQPGVCMLHNLLADSN